MERATLETIVQELTDEHPDLNRVFEAHGIVLDERCLSVTEYTLEDASNICGFDAQEMIDALNQALEHTEKKK